MKLFRMNRIGRTSHKLSLINGFRTKRAKRSILSKATRLYNTIPATLKSLSPKLLKIKLKQIRVDEVPGDWSILTWPSYYPDSETTAKIHGNKNSLYRAQPLASLPSQGFFNLLTRSRIDVSHAHWYVTSWSRARPLAGFIFKFFPQLWFYIKAYKKHKRQLVNEVLHCDS